MSIFSRFLIVCLTTSLVLPSFGWMSTCVCGMDVEAFDPCACSSCAPEDSTAKSGCSHCCATSNKKKENKSRDSRLTLNSECKCHSKLTTTTTRIVSKRTSTVTSNSLVVFVEPVVVKTATVRRHSISHLDRDGPPNAKTSLHIMLCTWLA